jgi:hypothetical protein
LCIAADAELRRELGQLVAQAGATPDCIAGAADLPPGPIQHAFVLAGLDDNDASQQAVADRLRPSAELVAVLPSPSLAAFTRCLRGIRCNHVLTRGATLPIVSIITTKLLTGDIFGIEKYLPQRTPVRLTRLHDFDGRGRAIDEILKFAEESGVRSKIRSSIGQVCEELLMNALYDAPTDHDGRQIFGEVDPKARVDLCSPRPVSIRYAATGETFVVAVRDRFGSLRKQVVLDYIDKCLHATDQIDRKTYGAGLGLYLIANAAGYLCLNVAPGMATEVICAFDRQKARAPLGMLSVFVHPGAAAQSRPE